MEQHHLSTCIERTLHNYALSGASLPVFEASSKVVQVSKKSQLPQAGSVKTLEYSLKGNNGFSDLLASSLTYGRISPENAEQILDKTLEVLTTVQGTSASNAVVKPKYLGHVSTSSKKGQRRIVIVGSIHGQLQDFDLILSKYGLPSVLNQYIFNGNLIHGPNSVELLLLTFFLKCIRPRDVTILRGPHELTKFYYFYGFRDELISRHYNQTICNKFDKVIQLLPLMSIINDQALVMSGGPAPNLKREDIERLNEPVDKLPSESPIYEMMWSEPKASDGFERSDRIVGYMFGPTETKKFLSDFRVSKLIRSFGVPKEEELVVHNEECISVFSASNYKNIENNNSTTIVYTHENIIDLHTNIIKTEPQLTTRDWLVEYNVFMMNKLILMASQRLQDEFRAEEQKQKGAEGVAPGLITVESWLSVMGRVMGKGFPWEKLRLNLIPKTSDGLLDWISFLKINCQTESQNVLLNLSDSVGQRFLKNHKTAEELFDSIDGDKDGSVSYQELALKIKEMSRDVSEVAVNYFLDHMDKNHDGVVTKVEFSQCFRITFGVQDAGLTSLEISKVKGFYNRLREEIQKSDKSIKELFSRYTENGSSLTDDSLFTMASHYNIILNTNQTAYLLSMVDTNGDGKVDFQEFVESFAAIRLVDPDAASGWKKKLLNRAAGVLSRKFGNLRSAFIELDKDGSGSISLDELRERVSELNRSGENIPDEDVRFLMQMMDINKDGTVSYPEFVSVFSEFISYAVGE